MKNPRQLLTVWKTKGLARREKYTWDIHNPVVQILTEAL